MQTWSNLRELVKDESLIKETQEIYILSKKIAGMLLTESTPNHLMTFRGNRTKNERISLEKSVCLWHNQSGQTIKR